MLHIFEHVDELLVSLADFIKERSQEAIRKRGKFSMVLSGGSSPKRLYTLLAERYGKQIEWDKVSFFFGDERFVPHDHPDSNYLMAKESLFDPLGINKRQIFPINTKLDPEAAAKAYEKDIATFFGDAVKSFDLILLGLGDNVHTASLFPFTTVLHEKKALVKDVWVEEVKMFRITLTAPLINLARHIAFLVYGKSKAEAVHHALKGETNIEQYPAQLINPGNGEVHWFLDNAAHPE